MRYAPAHKERTRARILRVGGRLFRRFGYTGVGIDRIMASARLTRGGFYGYFRSKAGLFAEALAEEHGLVRLLRSRKGSHARDLQREARQILADYLHPDHRDEVGVGCYLAASSTDVTRAGRPARHAYEVIVRGVADELARGMSSTSELDPRALTTIALLVGGLSVARAVDDDHLARAVLRAAEDGVHEQLTRSS